MFYLLQFPTIGRKFSKMNLLADSFFVGTNEMKNNILDTRSSYTSFKKNSMVLEFFRGMPVKFVLLDTISISSLFR